MTMRRYEIKTIDYNDLLNSDRCYWYELATNEQLVIKQFTEYFKDKYNVIPEIISIKIADISYPD